MLLLSSLSTDDDLKGAASSRHGMVPVPGFPTEGRSLPGGHPLVARAVTRADRSRLRAHSIENGQASWLKTKLFKKEASWPRDLYLRVLGCKGLAPPSAPDTYHPPDGSTTTTASNSTTASMSHISAIFAAVGGAGASTSFVPSSPCRARSGTNVSLNAVAESSEDNASSAHPGRGDPGEGSEQEQEQDVVPSAVLRSATSDKASGSSTDERDADWVGRAPQGGSSRTGFAERDKVVAEAGQDEDDDEEEDEDDDEEDEGFGGRPEAVQCGAERELDWVVRVTNTNTGNDLHTRIAKSGVDPSFGDAFVVPCQGPRDAVVIGVYGGVGHVDETMLVGEAVLPLDARFLAGNHTVLLKLSDARGRTRGFVRVEAFWVDEAKPRREAGEFYFRVVHPSGVNLRELPSMECPKGLYSMRPGEVFRASERLQHAGEHDEDGVVYVKVSGSTDRWARSGWCFEALTDEHGRREPVLERVNAPKRERGHFFYRVRASQGVRLHSRPDLHSVLRKEAIPAGTLLEASEIWTPAGSPVSFVSVDLDRGFIVMKVGEKVVRSPKGQLALEAVECPEGVIVSSQGTGVGVPPPPMPTQSEPTARPGGAGDESVEANGVSASPPALASSSSSSRSSRASTSNGPSSSTNHGAAPSKLAEVEAAAAARLLRERIYRVRSLEGVPATISPDLASDVSGMLEKGEPFRGNAEVVKRYEGLGEVAFIQRAEDSLWVRANRPEGLLLELIMDRVEAGAFTYRVSHENGVVVRTAPGLDAPIVKPRRILPVKKLINVCERLTRAEDIVSMSRPPVFLRLAGNDGWVFDKRGHTHVCEDVTELSRIATANAITAEAVRLVRMM